MAQGGHQLVTELGLFKRNLTTIFFLFSNAYDENLFLKWKQLLKCLNMKI